MELSWAWKRQTTYLEYMITVTEANGRFTPRVTRPVGLIEHDGRVSEVWSAASSASLDPRCSGREDCHRQRPHPIGLAWANGSVQERAEINGLCCNLLTTVNSSSTPVIQLTLSARTLRTADVLLVNRA